MNAPSVTRPVALRTALIWRDEVMHDIVADAPQKITVGHKGKPTFVVPDVGLPPGFAIVSPGNRGYVLTLSEGMRGTICIDGKEQSVADYVQREGGSSSGGFCATPIGGRDWGVVDLDDSGDYKIYFQFVPVEAPLPSQADLFTMLTLAGAAAVMFIVGLVAAGMVVVTLMAGSFEEALPRLGILMACAYAAGHLATEPGTRMRVIFSRFAIGGAAVLALMGLAWVQMQIDFGALEWVMRGALLIPAGVIVFGMCWSLAMSDPEQQASTGFSIVLHGALLIGTIIIYDPNDDPNVWPGPRALTGAYLTDRIEPVKPPEPEKMVPTLGKVEKQDAAPKSENKQNLKTATKNDEGASGGKGDQERARNKDAKDNEKPDPPKIAFFEDKNKKILDNIIDKSVNVGAFAGIKGDTTRKGALGFGNGTGTGVGDEQGGTGTTRGSKGKGTGGGGNVEGDFVTNKGKVDMGTDRPGGNCKGPNCKGAGPKEVQVNVGEMSGDPGGYTEEEINRVVKRSAGMFRACYQKELNRSPGIGGKIVVKFKIGADGAVITASPTGGTTLANEAVKDCVARNVNRLKFPPKGAIANVTYPFLFSPGG